MREGTEEQMRRLFGIAPYTGRAEAGTPLMQDTPGSDVTSPMLSHAPSNFVRVPKTLLADMRVYSVIAKHPINMKENFIGDKSPVDVMLEKQQRALSNENIYVQYHYPQQRTLVVSTHAARNTFEVKVRPFKREVDRVRMVTPEEETSLLEAVELPYRKMPGVDVSWTKEAIYVGDKIQEYSVLLLTLGKSDEAKRARVIIDQVMQNKSPIIS